MSAEPNQVKWRGIRLAQGETALPVDKPKVSTGTYDQVSVSSTATEIVASNTSRITALVRNHSTVDVFIGSDSSVTTSNGILVRAKEVISFEAYSGSIFGIVASGSATCGYIEF